MLYAFPDSFDGEASLGNDPVRECPSALRGETKSTCTQRQVAKTPNGWSAPATLQGRENLLLAVNLPR
jgi:hypothetical protein